MDEDECTALPRVFYCFVSVTLTLLLGLNIYAYVWGPPLVDSLDVDLSDIKQLVVQLTNGLYEVNRKHHRLKVEMERITATLPGVAAAADQTKEVLEPSLKSNEAALSPADVNEYDQQMTDFALESAGGKVLDTGDTVEHVLMESPVVWALYMLSSFLCRGCQGASVMLQPGSLPGECWAFRGSKGEATIRLLGAVLITGVSLQHISPQISATREISSAPRFFQIEGLDSRNAQNPHDFGTYEYDKDGKQIQYFEMKNPSSSGYHLVRVRILSNWGHPVYTCVYRLRVHGELAPGQGQPMPTQRTEFAPQIDSYRSTDKNSN